MYLHCPEFILTRWWPPSLPATPPGVVAKIDVDDSQLHLIVVVDEHAVAVEGEERPMLREHSRKPRALLNA